MGMDSDKEEEMAGKLFLCATPIGNLEDMSYRAIRILKEVDLIAAEDTRHSIKLLNHFDIKTPMTSYHEYNKVDKAKVLVDKMLEGAFVALITDAGTPGISDPGEELVRQAADAGIEISPVPGPAACICALIMSGMPTRRFCFEAFLPSDKKERRMILEELKCETRTIVLHEAPHHLIKTLNDLFDVLGDRRISVCKEITKKYENVHRFTIKDAISYYEDNPPRGEYVLVIEGADVKEIEKEKQKQWDEITIEAHLSIYLDKGMDKKEAMKAVAKDRGISKRDVYQALL